MVPTFRKLFSLRGMNFMNQFYVQVDGVAMGSPVFYVCDYFTNKPDPSEVDLLLAPNEQREFLDFCSNSTLGKVVSQGKKLRNEKPRYLSHHECDVINIDYIKTPCDHRRRSCSRKRIRNTYSPRSSPIFLRSGITVLPCTDYGKRLCQPKHLRKKSKSRPHCPLRIAELAVPTKRQCLHTWRSKHSILPDYMVERLKQQVLDQRPIVQLSDAINCFKTRKRSLSKRSDKNGKNIKRIRNRCDSATKVLCAIFGHKIALYLSKPMAVSLTPRLERISTIVADEMFYIMLKRKMCMNSTFNQRILHEMAGKVSIWIAMILEESTYKLQGDELNDLEEEIGPVLNLIDDLIENVLDICAPDTIDYILSFHNQSKESSFDEDKKRSLSEISLSEETHGSDEFAAIDEDFDKIESEEQLDHIKEVEIFENEETISISSFLRNEVYDIVLNMEMEFENDLKDDLIVNKPEDDSLQIQMPNNDTDQFLDSLELQPEIESTLSKSEDVTEIQDKIAEFNENMNTDEVQLDLLKTNIEEEKENIIDSTDPNVSEKSQIFFEEPDDDINKKVTFSDIDMGPKGQLKIHSDTHLLDAHVESEKEQVSWKSSADNIKQSSIIFAPPNENLLSDADESWPENITSPVLRPSESISRSITSLGRILETDEKLLVTSESDDELKNYKQEVDQRIRDSMESLKTDGLKPMDEKKQINKKVLKNKKNPGLKEKNVDSFRPQKLSSSRESKKSTSTKQVSPLKITQQTKLERTKYPAKVKDQRTVEKDHDLKSEKNKKYFNKTDIIPMNFSKAMDKQAKSINKQHPISPQEGSHIMKNLDEKDVQYKKAKEIHKPHPKWDYRVNEATAPAWLMRKHANSHQDLNFRRNQYEIRKWCKDLEHEFARFEKWDDWLKCMCRNFATMHQCQAAFRRVTRCDFKNWLKFKSNIDKNISTWVKLNRRAQCRLNQTIYICVKTSEIASPKRYSSRCLGRNLKKTQSSPHCASYK